MRRTSSPALLLGELPRVPALIGVSGGRDSVALLHSLTAAQQDFTVCHLDHALRPESTEDAEFARQLAARYGLPFVTARVDVGEFAKRDQLSVETAARQARHRFFARTAAELNVHDIILAHHADDQVETFLLNLLRGAGTTGLRAILPVTTHVIDGVSLNFHRPMLGVWRQEIDAYIAAHHLEFREDLSNQDEAFTRNRMRHQIIPFLTESFGRDVTGAIWKAAEITRAEQEWLTELIAPILRDTPTLDVHQMRSLPLAAQRRVLLHWLRANGAADLGFEDVESVRGLLTADQPAKVNLARGLHVRRRAGKLFIEP